jgi:hypothetical protein
MAKTKVSTIAVLIGMPTFLQQASIDILEQLASVQVFARPRTFGLPWFVNGVRTQRARRLLATLTSQRSRTAPKAAGPTLSGSILVWLSSWAKVNQLRAAKRGRRRVAAFPPAQRPADAEGNAAGAFKRMLEPAIGAQSQDRGIEHFFLHFTKPGMSEKPPQKNKNLALRVFLPLRNRAG